jgi:hypothetical protein
LKCIDTQTSREKIELLAAYLGKIVIANKGKHGHRKHEKVVRIGFTSSPVLANIGRP